MRRFAKPLGEQSPRGFESLPPRHSFPRSRAICIAESRFSHLWRSPEVLFLPRVCPGRYRARATIKAAVLAALSARPGAFSRAPASGAWPCAPSRSASNAARQSALLKDEYSFVSGLCKIHRVATFSHVKWLSSTTCETMNQSCPTIADTMQVHRPSDLRFDWRAHYHLLSPVRLAPSSRRGGDIQRYQAR